MGPASTDILEDFQGAKPPSRRYHTRVDLGPPLLCIHGHHGGPCLPRRPRHLGRGSLCVLSPSLYNLQLPRILHIHRLSYPLLRGLGVQCFTVTRYPRTWIVVPRTFTESPTMIYQHWQWTRGFGILCDWSIGIHCCHL